VYGSIDVGSLREHWPKDAPRALRLLHSFLDDYWAPKFQMTAAMKRVLEDGSLSERETRERLAREARMSIGSELGVSGEKMNWDDLLALKTLHQRNLHSNDAVQKIVKLSEQHGGLHAYYAKKRPAFYEEFLTETKLPEGFLEPGKKFEAEYAAEKLKLKEGALDWAEIEPIESKEKALKQSLSLLRKAAQDAKRKGDPALWNGLGRVVRKAAGELPGDIVEHEYKDAGKVAGELLAWLQGAPIPRDSPVRRRAALDLLQVRAFGATKELRGRIAAASGFDKASLIHEYYVDAIKLHQLEGVGRSMKEAVLVPEINRRVRLIDVAREAVAGAARSGKLEFRLSERGLKTLCKGIIGEDCLSGNMGEEIFLDGGVGQTVDPSVLNFEIYDDNRWVGNMYTVVVKDDKGRAGLIVDTLQVKTSHPLASADERDARKFGKRVFSELKDWGKGKFKFFALTSRNASNRDVLNKGLSAAAGKGETLELQRLGGGKAMKHFGLKGESFVQFFSRGGGSGAHYVKEL
jgi:hypothetical protein